MTNARAAQLAVLLLAPSVHAARVNTGLNEERQVLTAADLLWEKEGSGDSVNYHVDFNASTSQYGNNVGRLKVTFPGGAAQLTNQGFASYPPPGWAPGSLLAKADEYVWQLSGGGTNTFTFDHGASDLVFGDVSSSGGSFRPEFDELIYGVQSSSQFQGYIRPPSTPQEALQKQLLEESKESTLKMGTWNPNGFFTEGMGNAMGMQPGMGMGGHGFGGNAMGGHGMNPSMGGSSSSTFTYTPRLKLKAGSDSFTKLGRTSSFTSATLMRPSILDIDNLFAVKASVPSTLRSSMEVQSDQQYRTAMPGMQPGFNNGMQPGFNNGMQPGFNNGMQPGLNNGGHQPGFNNGMQPGFNNGMQPGFNNGMQPGFNNGGHQPGFNNGMQPGFNNGMQPGFNNGMQPGFNNGMQPGFSGHSRRRPGMQPGFSGHSRRRPGTGYNTGGGYNMGGNRVTSRCFPEQGGLASLGAVLGKRCGDPGEQCSTSQECRQMGGRWKQKYCTGASGCGCCKEIGMHRFMLAELNETEEPMLLEPASLAEVDDASQSSIPVQLSVEWLTPVLQKFRCVSVAPRYAKMGGQSLFIAMGWDTESGVQNLDLDLSLVPFDAKKNLLFHKTIYYNQKTPQSLACGHGSYAMRAFSDDRSGDEPGDDELVKIDLGCLSQMHQDVEAVVVLVNIFTPQGLTWSEIDSAYLRIISGGMEQQRGGNYFVNNAEAVRSFVRLSGNDLKRDPDLQNSGLAVGMFFRQPQGSSSPDWAFAALMKGLPGRNVEDSGPLLQPMLKDLVYPANPNWDKTAEQQQATASGAFGSNGVHGKGNTLSLVKQGQLPCVASRKDHAMLLMGNMNTQALDGVLANPNVPKDVKGIAKGIKKGGKVADQVRELAQTVDLLEDANTDTDRQQIAKTPVDVREPTVQESEEAEDELDSLFDDI